mmetsp:Transcript_34228/g.72910  ORF Transcript_34228/g.72910 Transcript_34228/m.72910 type:complete len:248 (+) Transcript_34228:1048-1791(+)
MKMKKAMNRMLKSDRLNHSQTLRFSVLLSDSSELTGCIVWSWNSCPKRMSRATTMVQKTRKRVMLMAKFNIVCCKPTRPKEADNKGAAVAVPTPPPEKANPTQSPLRAFGVNKYITFTEIMKVIAEPRAATTPCQKIQASNEPAPTSMKRPRESMQEAIAKVFNSPNFEASSGVMTPPTPYMASIRAGTKEVLPRDSWKVSRSSETKTPKVMAITPAKPMIEKPKRLAPNAEKHLVPLQPSSSTPEE